jgi:Family of unknown function (DUF5899)
MELAILGGLFVAAKKMSGTCKNSRYQHTNIQPCAASNQYPNAIDVADSRGASAARNTLAAVSENYEKSLDPRTTGIISPYYQQLGQGQFPQSQSTVQPYFSSEKKQNYNQKVVQTKLEMFTGALDACSSSTGVYRNKSEHPTLFAPTESMVQVTSGGTAGNPQMVEDQSKYWVSGKKNNTGPIQPIRVGPGLGVGTDVAATGGYQQYYRILPKNVGEYKKTGALPGRINPGGSTVQRPQAPALMQRNHRPKVFEAQDLGVANKSAYGHAPTARQNYENFQGNMHSQESYVGVASGALAPSTGTANSTYTRGKDDNHSNGAARMIGVNDTRQGQGAFVGTNYELRPTDRAWKESLPMGVPGKSTGAGGYVSASYDARTTGRQTIQSALPMGGPSSFTASGAMTPSVQGTVPRTTIKEQTGGNFHVGGAGTTVSAPANDSYITRNIDHSKTKRDQLLHAHTPGVQTVNNFNNDIGQVVGRGDAHHQRVPAPRGDSTGTYASVGQITTRHHGLDRNPHDTPENFGIRAKQVANNPLAGKPLWG